MKYSKDHLWISSAGSNLARIGVTFHYLDRLAAVTIFEPSPVSAGVKRGEALATLESSKTALDLPSPLTGIIKAVNQKAIDEPGLINRDPLGSGWLVELEYSDPAELDELLTPGDYQRYALE